MNYTISEDGKSITCHKCGRTSYHPEDVREKYCGHCHVFLETGRIHSGVLDKLSFVSKKNEKT